MVARAVIQRWVARPLRHQLDVASETLVLRAGALAACVQRYCVWSPDALGTGRRGGGAYMETSVYYDEGRPITLDWDRQALDWLRQNVHGMPTIVEANTPLYRWGSRVSVYTGLPTVIGWDWHQKQQRSVLPGQTIDQRIADVRTIYTSADPNQTMRLLDQYRVRYIYIGPLERIYYAGNTLNKFDQQEGLLWSLVYQNEQVKIYEVH